jgi:hypothetical protein
MDTLQKKLSAVEAALGRDVWVDPDFVGIRIDETGSTLTFVVRTTGRSTTFSQEVAGSSALQAVLRAESLSSQIVVETMPTPSGAKAGSGGYGQGLPGYGTLGWFIVLDGVLVAVSNHHVLCANGDDTPMGTPVFSLSQGRIGQLYDFDPLSTASPRLFDFALAEISSPSSVEPVFAACESGQVYRYPMRLGLSENLGATQTYYTVGARAPTCAEGRFKGVTTTKVGPYTDGRDYVFNDQLLFDPISSPGDSGSIVVEKHSNRVVGLIFAGRTGVLSLANPLYRKGWTFLGSRAVDQLEVPVFATANKIKSQDVGAMTGFPDQGSSTLPPIFQAGRGFNSWSSFAEFSAVFGRSGNTWIESASVVQPLGEWVEIKIKIGRNGNNFPVFPGNGSNFWVHTATGVIYG